MPDELVQVRYKLLLAWMRVLHLRRNTVGVECLGMFYMLECLLGLINTCKNSAFGIVKGGVSIEYRVLL